MNSSKTKLQPTEIAPARFRLTSGEVAAGFARLGLAPLPTALYADLPDPAPSLPKHMVAKGNDLTPEAAALFTVLAAPDQSIAVNSIVLGSTMTLQARIAGDTGTERYVMVSKDEDGAWDMALLTSRDQALVVIDDLVGLTTARSGESRFSVRLSRNGLAALSTIADLLSEEALRSRLEGRPNLMNVASGPLDLTDLKRGLEQGIERPGPYSAVMVATLVSDGTIAAAKSVQALDAGVQQLGTLGLVDDDGVLTVSGLGLATFLSTLRSATSILVATSSGGAARVDWMVVLRSSVGLLFGVWDGTPGNNSNLLISEASAGTVMASLEKSLKAAPASDGNAAGQPPRGPDKQPARCRACGAGLKSGRKFCTACGATVAA